MLSGREHIARIYPLTAFKGCAHVAGLLDPLRDWGQRFRVRLDAEALAFEYRQPYAQINSCGMPKLRQNMADGVFYLYRRDSKTNRITGPHGTGFFVVQSPSATK